MGGRLINKGVRMLGSGVKTKDSDTNMSKAMQHVVNTIWLVRVVDLHNTSERSRGSLRGGLVGVQGLGEVIVIKDLSRPIGGLEDPIGGRNWFSTCRDR